MFSGGVAHTVICASQDTCAKQWKGCHAPCIERGLRIILRSVSSTCHGALGRHQEMCLGVYESFVNLNPYHVDHFLHTADLEGLHLRVVEGSAFDGLAMLAMRLERRDFASTSSSLSDVLALPRPNPFTPLNWTKVMVCVGYCGSLWVVLLGGPFFWTPTP